MHTSTNTRLNGLTSAAIRIRNLDCHQNLIICSLAHCQPSLKISCKSVRKFLRKVANRQTTISLRKLILLDESNDQIVNTIAQQNADIYKKANKDMKTMYFEKYTRLNKIVKLGKYSYYMQKI